MSIRIDKKNSNENIVTVSKMLYKEFMNEVVTINPSFNAILGTHEIFAVISQDDIAKWYLRSYDFPQCPFKSKVGGILPRATVTSEFFTTADSKYTAIQKLSTDEWFYPFVNDSRTNRTLYEQCFYSDNFNYVISPLWPK